MVSISFVVAAYNEIENISYTIEEIVKCIKDLKIKKTEIIVIDDCSQDLTFKEIKNIKIKFPDISIRSYRNLKNLGFGGSIKKGLKLAVHDKILWLPGDNSHLSSEIKKILYESDNNYCIVSTFYINTQHRDFVRRVFTKLYTPLLNFIFQLDLPYYNGFSLMDKKYIQQIKIKTNSHSWQVEFWVKAKFLKDFKYKFIPTILKDRIKGATAFKFKNSIKVIYNIIRLIFLNFYLKCKLNFFN